MPGLLSQAHPTGRVAGWQSISLAAVWGAIFLAGLIVAALLGDSRLLPVGVVWLTGLLLPGYLFIARFGPADLTPAERLAFSLGAGYGLLVLLAFALQAIPGPLSRGLVIGGYVGLVLGLAGLYFLRTTRQVSRITPTSVTLQRTRSLDWVAIAAILAIGLIFRLPNLGYSEFQGDEAKVMLRAASVLQGRDDTLLLHKKGPAEILLPTLLYSVQGTIDEATARLPFAIAGLAGLVVIYCLGQRLFNWRVGLAAALLLAINGYSIAFSRIVQYQGLVFLFTSLAILAFVRFYQDGTTNDQRPTTNDRFVVRRSSFVVRRFDLTLGLVFLGVGLLAHYETVLVGLVPLYLLGRKADWRLSGLRPYLAPLLVGGAVAAAMAAAFYVPLVLHPYFRSTTLEYLADRRGLGALLYNNLGDFFATATFYNSTYYLVVMILLMGGVIVWALRGLGGRIGALLVPAAFLAGGVALLVLPSAWQIGPVNAAGALFLALAIAVLVSRRSSAELRACWLWFFPPFLLLGFAVEQPWTHFYILFPAWALLAGLALDRFWIGGVGAQNPKPARWIAALAMSALYAVCAYYVYFVFVQHDIEYKRTYPAYKPALFWTVYGDSLPKHGWFGFPYQAGWKTIGTLFADGTLVGDFDSNEESEITSWYTRGAVRCARNPHYYFVAENVQDPHDVPAEVIQADYAPVGSVLVGGQTKIRLFERKPAQSTPTTYEAADYITRFDAAAAPAFDTELPYSDGTHVQQWVDANLDNQIRLIGFDLDRTTVQPGGALGLTVYWQALQQMDISYNVFVHVETDQIWGQRDGIPNCGLKPTNNWQPGEAVIDRISVPLDANTPPGHYPLLVGMYDWATGKRLDVLDAAGNPVDNQIELTQIEVRP